MAYISKGLARLSVSLSMIGWLSGGTVIQYNASGFAQKDGLPVWRDVWGRNPLAAVHADSSEWTVPALAGGMVRFDLSAASPMCFPDSATNRAAYAMAVIRCSGPASYASLLDATCSLRFRRNLFADTSPDSDFGPDWAFAEEQAGETLTVAVNGENTAGFIPSESLQLVEAEFSMPVGLADIYIGGSPADPGWGRNWQGGIMSLIFFTEYPAESELAAVRYYLARDCGLDFPFPYSPDFPRILTDLGVDTGEMFGTIIGVR